MKQVSVVIALAMVLAGVVFGFVLPSTGSSNHEILIRKWIEESPVLEDSLKENASTKKRKENEEKNESASVKIVSNENPKLLKKEAKGSEETTTSGKSKVRKVTKQESLKVAPLKFSRAAHFRPVERIVSDTIVVVADSLQENGKALTLEGE